MAATQLSAQCAVAQQARCAGKRSKMLGGDTVGGQQQADKIDGLSVKVGDGGRVCIRTTGTTDLVADILGYYPGTQLG